MTDLLVLLLVAAAALGLVCRPIGSPLQRCIALVAVLVFGGAALDPAAVGWTSAVPRRAEVGLEAGSAPSTAALVGGGRVGPAARDLAITWRAPLPNVQPGPFGASATFPGQPLPLQPEHVQLRALRAPTLGRPTVLEVALDAAPGPFDAVVTVHEAGREVLREVVRLDGSKPVEVPFTPSSAGPHTVAVAIDCAGHRVERTGGFEVAPAPRILVLDPSGVAAAALRAQGVAVVEVAELPADFRDLAAVVIGGPVPAARQAELALAVADGLGLFLLAPGFGVPGEPLRALLPVRPLPATEPGPGNAVRTGPPTPEPVAPPPVAPPTPPAPDKPPAGNTAEASPVSNTPIEVDKRSIAIVLVVDRSGSMGNVVGSGKTKMSYAKTSALRTAEHLTEGDQVAVVTFGLKDRGRVDLPLTDATDRERVREKIERIEWGDGGTYLLSGLREAKKQLQTSKAAVKHIVVVTDGAWNASEGLALGAEVNGIREDCHATTTIISITSPSDLRDFTKDAQKLVMTGGGFFFELNDAQDVPVFVSAEVTRALSKVGRKPRDAAGTNSEGTPPPAANEPAPPEPEPPPPEPPAPAPPQPAAPTRVAVRAVAESPLLAPAPAASWPTLGAATPATAPLDAQVLLVAGDAGWPLLAFGNRGLGRVGAFAADLCGAAGSEFRAEPPFAARLAQWVQSVLPAEPMRTPSPLLATATVTPPAPTPRELDQLARLAGSVAVSVDQLPAPPASVPLRVVQHLASPWSLGALLALLVLGVFERWLGMRAFRRA